MPLDLQQRLIAQLIFDTQPKKRAAYLKQLGYEINPKDDNEYKPIGSSEDYQEIDPGGILNFSQYGKPGGVSELGKDVLEGVLDQITQGIPIEAAGLATGAAGTVAGPAGALAGRSAGRAVAFNAIEAIKDQLGNLIVEDKMPADYALRATQTAIQSLGPEALSKAAPVLKKSISGSFDLISGGIRKLLKIGDGKIAPQAWEALKANPKLFQNDEVLSQAGTKIDLTIDQLLGTNATTNVPDFAESAFGKKMLATEAQRASAAAELSANKQADFNLSDTIKTLEAKIFEMSDPQKYPVSSQSRKDGISWIQDKITELKDLAGNQDPRNISLSFQQMDNTVKEMQRDLYSKSLIQKDWRDAVKSVVDGPMGLNVQLKDKATKLGSPYAQLKQKESQLFDAFDIAQKNINKQKARSVIIGGDNPLETTGTGLDVKTKGFGEAIQAADQALGTNITEALQTNQIQNNIWKGISESGSRGSGGALTAGAVGYGAGSLAERAFHMPSGTLAVPAAIGAATLSQPRIGVPVAVGASRASQAIEDAGSKIAASPVAQGLNQLGSQEVSSQISESLSPTPEPVQSSSAEDEFLKKYGLGP